MSATATTTAFLARVLGSPALAAEHPLVLGGGANGTTLELVEDGEVRAACTLLVRELVVGANRIRAGLVGSVATDPAFRRRGLATRLLARAERELAARGCLFALLWADTPDFYLARGWAPLGAEDDVLLVSELAPLLPAATRVRALRADDAEALHRLHSRHATRAERTPAEMRALLAIPGVLTLVREFTGGSGAPQPVAYACLGRGRDLADTLHEWAGEPEDVLALVRAHLERRFPAREPGALFLMAPPDAREIVQRLASLGAAARRGILGLGKLLDVDAAAALLGAALGEPRAVTQSGERLVLAGPLAGVEIEPEMLQVLLVGAPEVRTEAQAFLARLGYPHATLPLEPFVFGLDSI
jgi:GNAT superfamily N-acetyltransferase